MPCPTRSLLAFWVCRDYPVGRVTVAEKDPPPMSQTRFQIELEQEEDGRWIAEVADLPGVMAYGATREEASAAVQTLALLVLADSRQN